MTFRVHGNRIVSLLDGTITAGATSIDIADASDWPVPGTGEEVRATIQSTLGTEIISYGGISSNTLTSVTRGLEGTTGLAHTNNSVIEIRATADSYDRKKDLETVTTGITASTTQTQGQGALTTNINIISTCANANDTVTLMAANASYPQMCWVVNNGAETAQVFPASGDNLGEGVDTSTTVKAGNFKKFVSYDGTNWIEEIEGNSILEMLKIIAGNPGNEGTGITVDGTSYESVLKASDIGSSNVAQMILHRHSTTLCPMIVGARTHSDTASHTIVSADDELFCLYAVGWDGTDYKIAGKLSCEVDGTPGSSDMPGRWIFEVTPDGSKTPAEAVRISQDKTVKFSGHIEQSVEAGITASTTQTQGQQPLTNDVNEIATCATTNDTVTLASAAPGRSQLVINNGAETLQVFPASGDNLGAGVDTATTITAGSHKRFTAYDATNWIEE